jgi:hypothetical protein
MMNANNAVDIVVEGGPQSETDVEAIALVATRALKEAGFINSARVYVDGITGYVEKKMELDFATESIMHQIHERNPQYFNTPVIIASRTEPSFPAERRRFDRAQLQASQLVGVITDDDDPDEIWNNMPDWEKYKVLRESSTSM